MITIEDRESGARTVAIARVTMSGWQAFRLAAAARQNLETALNIDFGGYTMTEIMGGWLGCSEYGYQIEVSWDKARGFAGAMTLLETLLATYAAAVGAEWVHLETRQAMAHHFRVGKP